MDKFWSQFDKNSFKWYNNVQSSIKESVFYSQPCIVFIHECIRESSGELFYKPIPKCLWFKKLFDFEKYKQDCDDAYQMIAMVILSNENYNLLNDSLNNELKNKTRILQYCFRVWNLLG